MAMLASSLPAEMKCSCVAQLDWLGLAVETSPWASVREVLVRGSYSWSVGVLWLWTV